MRRKIAIIGAGSVYTPELVTEFFKDGGKLVPFDRMSLHDINPQRLEVVGGLTQRMAHRQGVPAKVTLTASLAAAVRDADFVITQMRVGGNAARYLDETIPLKYNVIGQETTGPGGLFKALRTIPALVAVAKAIRQHAPRAWMLNFANPSGIVTEGVLKAVPGTKMLGICSAQVGRAWWVSRALGVNPRRITLRSCGLNHLAWIYRICVDGRNVTDRFFKLPNKRLKLTGWDPGLLRSIRGVPIGYLHYFYDTASMIKHARKDGTRAQKVLKIEKILLKRYADKTLDVPPDELKLRGGSGYSVTMSTVMSALTGRRKVTIPMNVQAGKAWEGFGREQTVEIDSKLEPHAVTPLKVSLPEIPPSQLGLTHAVKAYETLTVEAALTGSYTKALAAMIANPLVPDRTVAKRILDEMLKAHRKHLPQFN